MIKPEEYLCQIDSGTLPIVDTTWSITDSAFVEWFPLVSIAGVMSVASGGTELNTPKAMGMNGFGWNWSVTTGGILSLNSTGTSLTSSDSIGALEDASGEIWHITVGFDGQVRVTSEDPLVNKYYYPAIVVSFEVTHQDDKFELYAVKPNMTMHRR